MNERREKIIAYLDGNMSDDEKLRFEETISSDAGLKREVEEIKNFLAQMKADAEPNVNDTYFINMLPEFHRRHTKKKKFVFSKAAYSLTGAAAVILILFILFSPGKTTEYSDIKELSSNLTEQEINEVLNQYENRYSLDELISSATSKTDSIVSNMIDNELNLSSDEASQMIAANYINTNELLNSLNESEANELYSQLINTDIIKGERQ
jgi:hypothetical protein